MAIDRRSILGLSAAGIGAPLLPAPARSAAVSLISLGIDVSHFGVHAGSPDDQSRPFQRAINAAAAARVPLFIPPGTYLVADLKLPIGAQLIGVRGATRLLLGNDKPLVSAEQSDQITLQGIVFDGDGLPLPDRHGLVMLRQTRAARISDCTVQSSGGHAVHLDQVSGEITHNSIIGAEKAAIFSLDANGLLVANNTVVNSGNNGIQVWRSRAGDDGTLVLANRIENVAATDGGSGQNGNAINVFRAANVIVGDNRIRNCAFSGVRGNSASNLQVRGNAISGAGEVALYSEFAFEGAVIAGNVVDDAAIGISITNFKEGGRLAVCQGNIVRNLARKGANQRDRDAQGVGIYVEADTAVTGNVVERAEAIGIRAGWGEYLRDVTITGNVVRSSPVGVAVSVTAGAGSAIVADNMIVGASDGAVVGMERYRPVTGDLAQDPANRIAQLTVSGNRVR